MTKRKPKVEPKPTPTAHETSVASDAVAEHPAATVASVAKESVAVGPSGACPICGTARSADVCPVDGYNFEVTK